MSKNSNSGLLTYGNYIVSPFCSDLVKNFMYSLRRDLRFSISSLNSGNSGNLQKFYFSDVNIILIILSNFLKSLYVFSTMCFCLLKKITSSN